MNETKIRVCPEHKYPVGILSERPEFVCLSTFHRMEIGDTEQTPFKELKIEVHIEEVK